MTINVSKRLKKLFSSRDANLLHDIFADTMKVTKSHVSLYSLISTKDQVFDLIEKLVESTCKYEIESKN